MHVTYMGYNEKNGKAMLASGGANEAAITLKKVDSGAKYELIEYWEPRDGSLLKEDLKAKFPWYLYLKTLNSQNYSKKEQAKNVLSYI